MKAGIPLDNGYVVPYNKILIRNFEAHINVEYCGWSMLIKYLFKYISKGADRIQYTIKRADLAPSAPMGQHVEIIDEIQNFVDGRYICPHEAAWRIINYPIHHRCPAVQILDVHLEDKQNIRFKDNQRLQNILRSPVATKTTLTEMLRGNVEDRSGRHLRYVNYLSEYWWEGTSRSWIRRLTNRSSTTIGRLIYIHPTSGELFYLRLLLTHQTGCTSFESVRTVSGQVYTTYREACEKLGLIGDDNEWHSAFTEASTWASAAELRTLFAHMLLFCGMSNPEELWKTHWRAMGDDMGRGIRHSLGLPTTFLNEEDLQQGVLYEVELLLKPCSYLSDYGLPMPSRQLLRALSNQLLMEERNYDIQALTKKYIDMLRNLNSEQQSIYERVMSSCANNEQLLLFIYGYGGTGKTYLWNTIIFALRSTRKIVLAVAVSGIASLLLPSGRTAHSRFRIPFEITEQSLCDIKKNTHLGELLLETCLIIWDEAPTTDRRCFESLDKALRDLLDSPHIPFGGKSVLLGGDFRQTLPVKKKGPKNKIIALSISSSYLWPHFRVVKLLQIMRLARPHLNDMEKSTVQCFSDWLLSIGDGKQGCNISEMSSDAKEIIIPSQFLIEDANEPLLKLIDFIYNDTILCVPNSENLSNRAIVCPKNQTANDVNTIVLNSCPGEIVSYLSTDFMVPIPKMEE